MIKDITDTYGITWLDLPDPALYKKHFSALYTHAIFFAQLAGATTAEQTESILKAATIPPVSFGAKRDVRQSRFTVSSYLGASAGVEIQDDKYLGFAGLFTPIGLELSRGTYREDSWAVMIAVLDFGNAVNKQIYNTDEKINYSDLIAPGVIISYGFKKVPLALNLSYSHGGSTFRHSSDSAHKLRLGITFDMPLFILY